MAAVRDRGRGSGWIERDGGSSEEWGRIGVSESDGIFDGEMVLGRVGGCRGGICGDSDGSRASCDWATSISIGCRDLPVGEEPTGEDLRAGSDLDPIIGGRSV